MDIVSDLYQEQEACKREQAAKEKEWDKLNHMEQNNLQLEATIAELERYCTSVKSTFKSGDPVTLVSVF